MVSSRLDSQTLVDLNSLPFTGPAFTPYLRTTGREWRKSFTVYQALICAPSSHTTISKYIVTLITSTNCYPKAGAGIP